MKASSDQPSRPRSLVPFHASRSKSKLSAKNSEKEKEDLYVEQPSASAGRKTHRKMDGSEKMPGTDCSSGPHQSLSTCEEDEENRSNLAQFLWFHGVVLNDHVIPLLKWHHSFVVRRSINAEGRTFLCISVREKEKVNHYALLKEQGSWECKKLLTNIGPAHACKNFLFIHHLIDYWSLHGESCIPIPRPTFLIESECVQIGKRLGSGAFGEVFSGTFKQNGVVKECAIKTMKGCMDRIKLNEFFGEAKIMAYFDHDNVVRFYGICSLHTPIMVLMELACGGTVRSYLRDTRVITYETMLSFAYDIAKGMSHLALNKIIHRDLAARNCLITPQLTAKVSDFGLSVRANEIKVKSLKRAPIRWLSPETLKTGVFNEKTDVWSYGVTYWEIFTKCSSVPLHPKTTMKATEEILNVEYPHKLPKCPSDVVEVLNQCTRKLPEDRPKFKTLIFIMMKLTETRKQKTRSKRKTAKRVKSGHPLLPAGMVRTSERKTSRSLPKSNSIKKAPQQGGDNNVT